MTKKKRSGKSPAGPTKAHEYVAVFVKLSETLPKAVAASIILGQLFDKVVSLSEKRGGSNEAVLGALSSTDELWRAISRRLEQHFEGEDAPGPDDFREVVRQTVPLIYEVWEGQKAAAKKARRRRQRGAS